MRCQEQLENYLREQQVAYQIQHHPAAYTAQRIADCEHISGKKVAKSVVVLADNQMVLLVLPASLRVDLDKARACLGVQEVRLAHESEFQTRFPNCQVGSMPPFGNLYNLPVCVDQSLTRQETIFFPIGTHTETMCVKYADFERLVQPRVADFALMPMHV
ncbi:MAG: YbaK/EbsC family protein [Ktedonobacteraceae bacterium]|nr:YbaK/EbsC family protein [Ktedonobacteraceae bacterium]MBO0795155.1 YbaK/EbsC family protein [Ktedonobacteraceae bacterium]